MSTINERTTTTAETQGRHDVKNAKDQPTLILREEKDTSANILDFLAFWYRVYFAQPLNSILLGVAKSFGVQRIRIFDFEFFPFDPKQAIFLRMMVIFPLAFSLKYGLFRMAAGFMVLHNLLDFWDDALIAAGTDPEGKKETKLAAFIATQLFHVTVLWTLWTSTYNTLFEAALQFSVTMLLLTLELKNSILNIRQYLKGRFSAPTEASLRGDFVVHLQGWGLVCLILSQTEYYPLFSWTGLFGMVSLTLCLLHYVRFNTSTSTAEDQVHSSTLLNDRNLHEKKYFDQAEAHSSVVQPSRSYAEAVRSNAQQQPISMDR